MITVARASTLEDAQVIALQLGSVGIQAFIPDEHTANIQPHIFLGQSSGVRVQVHEGDEELARKAIAGELDGEVSGEEE